MAKELSNCNALSIWIEVFGILILLGGTIFEYIYGRDIFLFFITTGSLIFSIGSGFVKKFPWAYVREGTDGKRKKGE